MADTPPPPPPPPPPPTLSFPPVPSSTAQPPNVPPEGPPGAFLVELLMYNGHPFLDHWAYFVLSHQADCLGVRIHATGSVNIGFELEIQRMHNVETYEDTPYKRIPLQWVQGGCFDVATMFNQFRAEMQIDKIPACPFEKSLFKVAAPEKSLNSVEKEEPPRSKQSVVHRNCQTWVVESGEQLVKDGILDESVVAYLRAVKQ